LQPSNKEQTRLSNHDSTSNKDYRRQKDGSSSGGNESSSSSNSTYSAFRQWRRSTSIGSHNSRSNSAGSRSPNSFNKLPNDPATIRKMEQFPLLLSDATMPDEDLSLKFLALVRTFPHLPLRGSRLQKTIPLRRRCNVAECSRSDGASQWCPLEEPIKVLVPIVGPSWWLCACWSRHSVEKEDRRQREHGAYRLRNLEQGRNVTGLHSKVIESSSSERTNENKSQDLTILVAASRRYYREVEYKGETFIELQDLLFGFNDPHVMDIKMGTRTFLESEVSKTTARPDLYQKMIQVDPNAPTQLEHEQHAVTKLRYMQFREQQSSTCSHGFRIEAMKLPGAPPITDLKKVKSHSEVLDTIKQFLGRREDTRLKILARLRNLRTKIEASKYFETHEVR